jgi:hypothetical protein
LITAEAFVGVMFASLCSAIIYAKVTRVQSFAQVTFSDPILIRYGDGVKKRGDDNASIELEAGRQGCPCPILEFRVINDRHATQGGEIMDANISVVVAMDASGNIPESSQVPNQIFSKVRVSIR